MLTVFIILSDFFILQQIITKTILMTFSVILINFQVIFVNIKAIQLKDFITVVFPIFNSLRAFF